MIVWDKVGLGVCFAPCDEILSPSLGFHVCLLFLSCPLCILVIDPGSSRVFLWRSAIISVGLWGHKNYPDSLAKTKVFLVGGRVWSVLERPVCRGASILARAWYMQLEHPPFSHSSITLSFPDTEQFLILLKQ